MYFVFFDKYLVVNDLSFDDNQMFLGLFDFLDDLLSVDSTLDLLHLDFQSDDSSVNDVFVSDSGLLSNNKNLSYDTSLDNFNLSDDFLGNLVSFDDLFV